MKLTRNFVLYSGVTMVLITVITGFSIGYGIMPLVSQLEQHMSVRFAPAGNVQSMLQSTDSSIYMIILSIFLVCMMFFLVQILFVLKKVVKPLKQVGDFAAKLARGNFNAELECDENDSDEIKELVRSLGFMRDRMQIYISRLQTSRSREQNARRKAESVNSLKGDFLTNMSLELKNPLNSIMGFSRILIKESEQGKYDDELLRKCRIIHQSAESLNSFIEKLFNLSRLDSGEHPVSLSILNTADFFHDLSEINRPEAEDKSIAITTCYSPSQPEKIVIDRDVFMNAMNMILSGIMRTSPSHSSIILGCETEGKNTCFWLKAPVAENGCICVASAYRKNFLRSSATRLSQLSGTIMVNLAIAKYSFDMLNARVFIDGPDSEGSVFKVVFNSEDIMYEDSEIASPARLGLHYATNYNLTLPEDADSQVDSFALESHFPLTIGLLDSDSNTSILIHELAKVAGHTLKHFKSESECHAAFEECPPDVMLLELNNSYSDCTFLVSEMVRCSGVNRPYIIVITTHVSEDEHQKLIIAGADQCMEKPVNIDKLLNQFAQLGRAKMMEQSDNEDY